MHDNHELDDGHTEYTEKGNSMEKSRQSRAMLGVKLDHETKVRKESRLEERAYLKKTGVGSDMKVDGINKKRQRRRTQGMRC